MNIQIPKAIIEVSEEEAGDLFHALRGNLEHSIDTHWVRHPQVYAEQSASRLHMMRELSRLLYSDAYPSAVADLKLRLERAIAELASRK